MSKFRSPRALKPSGKFTRNVGVLLVFTLTLVLSYSVAAQGDYIVTLTNIPDVDFDFSPTPAFTSGVATCTRSTLLVAVSADASCPNGA